jgi:hypothetical protein
MRTLIGTVALLVAAACLACEPSPNPACIAPTEGNATIVFLDNHLTMKPPIDHRILWY